MEVVKKSHVETVLRVQHGCDAELKSWDISRFTHLFDAFTSVVYELKVSYTKDGEDKTTCQMVKVNPHASTGAHGEFYQETFKKEGQFYFDVLPLLNTELSLAGQVNLRMPKPLFLGTDSSKEMVITEDMRLKGFRSHSRFNGFDIPHSNLVLKEYARLHGASMLLAKRSSRDNLLSKFPGLKSLWSHEPSVVAMYELFTGMQLGVLDVAEKVSGHEETAQKIAILIKKGDKLILETQATASKFDSLVQVDCFKENFLFKYAPSGCPEAVLILDFQLITFGSCVTDILCHLHSGLEGPLRRRHLQSLLFTYYATLSAIFSGVGEAAPFTMEDLTQEVTRMHFYGLIMGVWSCSVILENHLVEEFDPASGDTKIDYHRRQVVNAFAKDEAYRRRVMDVLDEIKQHNFD